MVPGLVPAGPARNTRESVVGHFCGKDRIVIYCVVVLNYLFGVSTNSQLPFLASFLVKMALFAKKPGSAQKSRVFALRIMGFPQELKTVRFNLEPKRCKSVSLSAKRSVFTLVGLAHGVVTEKLRLPYKVLALLGRSFGFGAGIAPYCKPCSRPRRPA
jgi:hypothetical protein